MGEVLLRLKLLLPLLPSVEAALLVMMVACVLVGW